MKVIVALILALSLLVPARPTQAAATVAAGDCTFVLGFKTLHDMIPDKVGACKASEYHNAQNGDGLQQTIGGLLVWRKADNWTAFTDGYRTWINGPNGLQQRLNTERFRWERDSQPNTTAAPFPGDPADWPTPGQGSKLPYLNDTRLMTICDGVAQEVTTASLPYIYQTSVNQFTSDLAFTCKIRAQSMGYAVPTCYRWSWLNAISRIPYLANPTRDVPLMVEDGYKTCMAANS